MLIATVLLATQLDACHVLSKKDVAAVQGESFTETKLSSRGNATTCFYQLPTFEKSISLDVMHNGARDFWTETLNKQIEARRARKKKDPRRVSGIGDEALWIGGLGSGSLYVRQGDAMVRVSVGGPGSDKDKIEKSKKLAVRVLKKM
ncbi:MAG TPA: hypothetical protein VF057_13985 [Thermoanaerobaculia bacterium]